jgi:hypothetical protein
MSDPPDSSTARISTLAAELRATIGKLSRRLRDQTHFNDLTWTQISVLYRLEQEGPATVTHLARAAGMRPHSMGCTTPSRASLMPPNRNSFTARSRC